MGLVLAWIVFAVVVGGVAGSNGKSFGGYFVLSLLLSPLIGLVILLIASVNNPAHKKVETPAEPEPLRYTHEGTVGHKTCPACGKEFDGTMTSCPHCGTVA